MNINSPLITPNFFYSNYCYLKKVQTKRGQWGHSSSLVRHIIPFLALHTTTQFQHIRLMPVPHVSQPSEQHRITTLRLPIFTIHHQTLQNTASLKVYEIHICITCHFSIIFTPQIYQFDFFTVYFFCHVFTNMPVTMRSNFINKTKQKSLTAVFTERRMHITRFSSTGMSPSWRRQEFITC